MILVTLTVESFDQFLETFATKGLPLRERHGSRSARVARHRDDEERVTLLFDWDADRFAGFLADPEVRATMREGGALGPPEVVHLEPEVAFEA